MAKFLLTTLSLFCVIALIALAGGGSNSVNLVEHNNYRISIEASYKYPGARGTFQVLEVVQIKTGRKWTVLRSSGSLSPPSVDDDHACSTMTVLSH